MNSTVTMKNEGPGLLDDCSIRVPGGFGVSGDLE
jgi:hypothetical protein